MSRPLSEVGPKIIDVDHERQRVVFEVPPRERGLSYPRWAVEVDESTDADHSAPRHPLTLEGDRYRRSRAGVRPVRVPAVFGADIADTSTAERSDNARPPNVMRC